MSNEVNNVVETVEEKVTPIVQETITVAGPIIERRASKKSYFVAGGIVLAIIAGATYGVSKKIDKKSAKKDIKDIEVETEFFEDADIANED